MHLFGSEIHVPHVFVVVEEFLQDFLDRFDMRLELRNLALDGPHSMQVFGVDLETHGFSSDLSLDDWIGQTFSVRSSMAGKAVPSS